MEKYLFGELSPEAKQTAISNHKSNFHIDGWEDGVIEDWKEKLEELGYEGVEIGYTGFWSQGDGASFTYQNVDISNEQVKVWLYSSLTEIEKSTIVDISVSGSRLGRYLHENSIQNNVVIDFKEDADDSIVNIVESKIEHNVGLMQIELSKKIYKALEDAYNSDEEDSYVEAELENKSDEEHELFFDVDGNDIKLTDLSLENEDGDITLGDTVTNGHGVVGIVKHINEDETLFIQCISENGEPCNNLLDDEDAGDWDILNSSNINVEDFEWDEIPQVIEKTPAVTNSLKDPEDLIGRKIQLSPMGEDEVIFEEFIQITDVNKVDEDDENSELEFQFLVVGENDYDYFLMERSEFEFFIENKQIDDISVLNSTYQMTIVENN